MVNPLVYTEMSQVRSLVGPYSNMADNNFNRDELLRFIAKAHRNTYAAPKEIRQKSKLKTPFLPGHKCYHFKDGDFEYFVEEAAQSYNGQLDEVAKSFSRLKFGRKLRSKDRPDEMQLRTFFDDISLNYARQGKVPSHLDLGRLYEENCVVSSNK